MVNVGHAARMHWIGRRCTGLEGGLSGSQDNFFHIQPRNHFVRLYNCQSHLLYHVQFESLQGLIMNANDTISICFSRRIDVYNPTDLFKIIINLYIDTIL
jgi:hypothetical protein